MAGTQKFQLVYFAVCLMSLNFDEKYALVVDGIVRFVHIDQMLLGYRKCKIVF